MCVQALSSCVPPSLLEGRPLKTTVITLVALGVLSILMGTLTSLSLQGALQTSLASVGWNGASAFVGGGTLLMILGYCLYASAKAETQASLSAKQKAWLASSPAFRIGEEKLDPKQVTCQRLYERGDTEETKIVRLDFKRIPKHVVLWYRHSLNESLGFWERAKELFAELKFNHYVAPLGVIELEMTVEVAGGGTKRDLAIFDRKKYPSHPDNQKDLYEYYQTTHEEEYRVYFGHILRLICQEGLHFTTPEKCFPLTESGKIILLRLDKSDDLQTSLQNFFDAMPSKWHAGFKEILEEKDRRSYIPSITSVVSEKREAKHAPFQAFLSERGVKKVTDSIRYKGSHQDLVTELNRALAKRPMRSLFYGRMVELQPIGDRQAFLGKCALLKIKGVIFNYKDTGKSVLVWC